MKKIIGSIREKKIFLPLIVANLFLLPGLAFAQSVNPIRNAIINIGSYFLNTLLDGLTVITGIIAAVASAILNVVLSPKFISWSYTGADNPVVTEGLKITQSFVNMALVLILVVIAFATILRISGYRAKELLVNLVIVALLVNFVPVIAGVVVDASNIIMYYFIGGDGISAGNLLARAGSEFLQSLDPLESTTFSQAGGEISETLALIFFNVILTFVLSIFTFIFIFRYVAIWVLVILAPLAFVSRILPLTKNVWKKWWNQFLQWCFVGAIAAFFLYLADHIANNITTAQILKADTNEMTGFFDYVFPHFVTIAFLILGLLASLKTSAEGANFAINLSKKAGKGIGRGAWELGGDAKDRINKSKWATTQRKRIDDFERNHPRSAAAIRGVGKGLIFAPLAMEEAPGGIGRYARRARETVGEASVGKLEKYLGVKSQKSFQRLFNEDFKSLQDMNSEDIARSFKAGRPERKAAAAAILAERGNISLLNDKQWEEALKILLEGKRKELGDILKKYPHMLLDEKKQEASRKTFVEILNGSAPVDISKNISNESLKSKEIVLHLIRDRETRNAMAKGSGEKRATIKKTISSLWGEKKFQELSPQEKEEINNILLDMSKDSRWNV